MGSVWKNVCWYFSSHILQPEKCVNLIMRVAKGNSPNSALIHSYLDKNNSTNYIPLGTYSEFLWDWVLASCIENKYIAIACYLMMLLRNQVEMLISYVSM